MTQTNLNNLLIERFMGFRHLDTELKYHISLDWLLPVIEKIETLENPKCKYANSLEVTSCTNYACVEYYGYEAGTIVEAEGPTRLDALYNCIIEFITWWNEIKYKHDN
jgi:hypothetical protein